MSSIEKGKYLHLTTPGQVPSAEVLKLYGLAINLPDRIMYSLSEINTVVPLPLSRDMNVADYAGYGVPLEGILPPTLPEHIATGMVRSLSDIFIHLFYLRPGAASDVILSQGVVVNPLTIEVPKGASKMAVRRVMVGDIKTLEISVNTGEVVNLPIPDEVFEERHVFSAIAGAGTRVRQYYSRMDGTLTQAASLLKEIPGKINKADAKLDFVVEFTPVNARVVVQGFKLGLHHYRYGTPILLPDDRRHPPLELTVVFAD